MLLDQFAHLLLRELKRMLEQFPVLSRKMDHDSVSPVHQRATQMRGCVDGTNTIPSPGLAATGRK